MMGQEPMMETARFSHVKTWIFDLDNTLYPPHADLWPKIDHKITLYIAHLLGLDGMSARALQKYYYLAHGTSLNGLMLEYGIDPHAFLRFVHDIDRSSLLPDARLAGAIKKLPGRKFIFTNGSCHHAEATLAQLGISGLFEDIFDIVAADFLPKPARKTYERFLDRHGIAPESAAMLEDIPHNLTVPRAMGMRTILVVPDARGDHKEDWERLEEGGTTPYDIITADLPAALDALARAFSSEACPRA